MSGPSRRISFSRLSASRAAIGLFALALLGAAIVVRAIGMQDSRDRQVEIRVREREAREAGGRDGHSVVRALPRDDFLLLRTAERVVDVPGELDRGIVGFGTGIREKRAAHSRRRHADQPFGELGGNRRDLAAEAVIERQLEHLLVRRFREPAFREAERCAPQPCHPFEIALAFVVVHVDTVAAGDHQRALRFARRADSSTDADGRRGRGARPVW